MKPISRRLSAHAARLFLLLILLILFAAGFSAFRFRLLTASLFREEMKHDALSMHYTIAYPEHYGIPADSAALTPYSKEQADLMASDLARLTKKLTAVPYFLPDPDSRLLLRLLKQEQRTRARQDEFPYYAEPLSPGSGIVSNLPVLLAEYPFRTEQDIKNYLKILSQIPAYLDGIAVYEQEKSQAGLFMSDAAADALILQCRTIMDSEKILRNEHFLGTTFSERLSELIEQKKLSSRQAFLYEQQNHLLLFEKVMPAYELLGDQILALKGSGHNNGGLANLPKGKEYYAFLFEETTGTKRPIGEVKKLLLTQLKKDTQALSKLLAGRPSLLAAPLEVSFPSMTPDECLADLQGRMQNDFPAFPDSAQVPSHTVKNVSESLADYCSPAFYLTPPIDDISENSIYINQKEKPDALTLYTTLAHEGYPGHLYQTVYDQLHRQQKKTSPARSLLHYGGYSEGWALYVEMRSYDYAKELLSEQNAPSDTLLLVDVLRLNRSIQLCLYSLLDIQIHAEAASLDTVSKYLKEFGITDADTASDIFEYIVQEPANYPKYYVGYLEFLMLREEAKKRWQEAYSDLRFHKLILEIGPCPFWILEKQL